MKNERYAYITLALLSVLVGVGAVLVSLNQINANNGKFCHLVSISNSYPVPKNPGTEINPIAERAWFMYNGYKDFGSSLGC